MVELACELARCSKTTENGFAERKIFYMFVGRFTELHASEAKEK